jgi:hypothetical protein
MIKSIGKKKEYTVNLLHAIRCADIAWRRVTEKNTRNCFRQAGIATGGQEASETTTVELLLLLLMVMMMVCLSE